MLSSSGWTGASPCLVFLDCLAFSCLVLSCIVLSCGCLVLSCGCTVLSCLVFVLSCGCLVLSCGCLVLSGGYLVVVLCLSYLILSCLVLSFLMSFVFTLYLPSICSHISAPSAPCFSRRCGGQHHSSSSILRGHSISGAPCLILSCLSLQLLVLPFSSTPRIVFLFNSSYCLCLVFVFKLTLGGCCLDLILRILCSSARACVCICALSA